MTPDEMRRHSEQLFEHQKDTDQSETTPKTITASAIELCRTIGAESPAFVPVVNDSLGMFGYCSDGVSQKVAADGGSIVFGWCIWEFPNLFLDAEFHAVWADAAGGLYDITPKPAGEERIVFAADRSVPQNFDFSKRPGNRRLRIYPETNVAASAADQIGKLRPHQRDYEERRAAKAGLTLQKWLEKKVAIDPLPKLIDDFLTGADRMDGMGILQKDSSTLIPDPGAYSALARKQIERIALIKKASRHFMV